MPEKDTIFSTKMKSTGVFTFSDFYQFCYDWLTDETQLFITEDKYKEKITGDVKGIEIEWTGIRKVTDYFKFEIKINFRVLGLQDIEVVRNGVKVKTNKGAVEMKIKGILVRDYQGKFEKTALQKFMRAIYEKWVIPSRIEEYEDKLAGDCDEFLSQAKAWLDLEGKR
jgi:hypothetical protein